GRVGTPGSLCLGPRDLRARIAGSDTGRLLDEAGRRWSFVLVGFRPGDPDLALVAERLLGGRAAAHEAFLLAPGLSDDEAALLGDELALTVVPIDGDGAAALEALAEAWSSVEAASRPAPEDVDGWLALWARDPSDSEAPRVLEAAAKRLLHEKSWDKLVEVLV